MSVPANAALEGKWQLVRAIYQGAAAPDEITQRTILEISSSSYAIKFDGKTSDRGTLEYVAHEAAKTITLVGQRGTNLGRSIRCIFQHVGERLRICYGLDGVLPSDFTASQGENRYLATYRKIAAP
jgi:uncharacterized protein (TIGR03067 family)